VTDAIVVGGSAGALEALMTIVGELPADAVAPVVVVIHVSAAFPSRLAAVLAQAAAGRDVHEAEDKEPLVPGTIVVAPPGYHLLVERSRRLSLSVDPPVHFSRPSIDVLFESAASALGDRVAGVVLSGGNADGAAGLAAIAAAGGASVIQGDAIHTPMTEAARDKVPRAAWLPARAIAGHLATLCRARYMEGP
jgi:two-component system chemotaxis response regulator CheB